MKNIIRIILGGMIVVTISVLIFTACNSVKPEANDAIYQTPDGIAYIANVSGAAPKHLGPPIQSVDVIFLKGANTADISYRNYMKQPPANRNDIFNIGFSNEPQNNSIPNLSNGSIVLKVIGLPDGITANVGSGAPNELFSWQQLIQFMITTNVKLNMYDFKIDVQINGTDFGTLPCTIKVI